jgi:hypothetical protein
VSLTATQCCCCSLLDSQVFGGSGNVVQACTLSLSLSLSLSLTHSHCACCVALCAHTPKPKDCTNSLVLFLYKLMPHETHSFPCLLKSWAVPFSTPTPCCLRRQCRRGYRGWHACPRQHMLIRHTRANTHSLHRE